MQFHPSIAPDLTPFLDAVEAAATIPADLPESFAEIPDRDDDAASDNRDAPLRWMPVACLLRRLGYSLGRTGAVIDHLAAGNSAASAPLLCSWHAATIAEVASVESLRTELEIRRMRRQSARANALHAADPSGPSAATWRLVLVLDQIDPIRSDLFAAAAVLVGLHYDGARMRRVLEHATQWKSVSCCPDLLTEWDRRATEAALPRDPEWGCSEWDADVWALNDAPAIAVPV